MGRLGISNTTRVVAYDERGGIYAARLWWILNYFGHANVALVDGGWVKWAADQRPIETAVPAVAAAAFKVKPGTVKVATAADIMAAIGKPGVKLLDARTQTRSTARICAASSVAASSSRPSPSTGRTRSTRRRRRSGQQPKSRSSIATKASCLQTR